MKKISILTIVLLAGLAAAAQTSKFKIAFRVSPNLSWAKPDDNNIESGKTVFRFGYGVMLDRMFSDNYAFGTGFEICQTGGMLVYKGSGKVNNEDRIWETTRTYNTKYIEIPLTLKLRTNEIGYITYWGQFGLGLGFNIRSRADEKVDYLLDRVSQDGVWSWQASNNENLNREDIDIKDDTRLFRTSLIMALGIEYNLSGSTSLVAGVTFNNGFSNFMNGSGASSNEKGNIIDVKGTEVNTKGTMPASYKLKAMNNYLALTVGVLF